MVLETLESPLDCKEIKPVNPQRNQSWVFIWRTDAEAKALVLWPLDVKSWLIGKDPDAGKDWRQEEKGMTEDDMVGWHHRLNGHEFEQALGGSGEQRSRPCHSPWGHKQSDMTWRLNSNTATTVLMWLLKSKDLRCKPTVLKGEGETETIPRLFMWTIHAQASRLLY